MLDSVMFLMEDLMTKPTVTFYYSRRKIGLYLLLNFCLLALALLFTWTVFPDYAPVYVYALAACAISLLSALIVFVFPMPLAVLDDKQIKIDHNAPLQWSQIKKLEEQYMDCFGMDRSILKIVPTALPNYKKSLMQKITDSSRFGMFSIPLYAMDKKAAKEITKLIKEHLQKETVQKSEAVKAPKKVKAKTKHVAKPKKAVTKKATATKKTVAPKTKSTSTVKKTTKKKTKPAKK